MNRENIKGNIRKWNILHDQSLEVQFVTVNMFKFKPCTGSTTGVIIDDTIIVSFEFSQNELDRINRGYRGHLK